MRMHWERQEQYTALNKLRARPRFRETASVLWVLLHSVCSQTAWVWPRLIIVHVHVAHIHSKCEYAAAVWWSSLADGISPHRLMHHIPVFFDVYCSHRCWSSLSGAIQYSHTSKFTGCISMTSKQDHEICFYAEHNLQFLITKYFNIHNVEFLCFQEPLLQS